MLRYEEEKIFIHVKWIRGVKTIDKGSVLQFMLKDGCVITLTSVGNFISETEVYTSLDKTESRDIIRSVYEGDMRGMTDLNLPQRMKISTAYGSEIYEIDARNARRLAKAYKLIQDEIKKSESK